MNEKKLLYISNRIFWPPMGGHEVEVFHYCRGLHEKYGYSIDVYAFDSLDKLAGVEKPTFLNNVYLSKNIKGVKKAKNIVFKSILSKEKWPLQNSLYYSEDNEEQIKELIEREKYDVVIVDMVRLAMYYNVFDGINCKKILNIEDTLSKRYKRQLSKVTKKTDIAGLYQSKLPVVLRKIIGASFIKKLILKTEIPRMEWAEEYYSSLFDNVIFVSEIETREFNQKYKTDKAVTVSLGVDYPFFSENIEVNKVEGKVTFVGNMATAANADSVRYIIDEVLPKCQNVKEAVFVGNCTENLMKDFSDNSKVRFTGKVSDLRAEVREGMVFLAPLAYGTGIKTKILEAMAMGMPVVTNSVGAEGIPAINGTHWFVSDDSKQLARYVDDLIESQALCNKIGNEARVFVRDNFQWDIIFEQFKKLGL